MFRQPAVDHYKAKWTGKALLLKGIPLWSVVTVCLLFLIILYLFISQLSYERRTRVVGETISVPRAVNLFSPQQGFISQVFVKAGDKVIEGQPLFQLKVDKTTHSGSVSESQRREIHQQISTIDNIITGLKNNKVATLASLAKEKEQYQQATAHSSTIITEAEKGAAVMKKSMEDYRQYLKKGLINQEQLTSQISLYYQQQGDLLALHSQNEQNQLRLSQVESEIQTKSAEFDQQIWQMNIQKFQLKRELASTDVSGALLMTSPVNGLVDAINVDNGLMVEKGRELVQIIPGNIEKYLLQLWVSDDALPYLKMGDVVNIRYQAFPAEKFGLFAGKIISIAKTPAAARENAGKSVPEATPKASNSRYKVLILPEQQVITTGGKTFPLTSGMQAETTLFFEKRKIWQWIISPFYNMKQSVTGVVSGRDER